MEDRWTLCLDIILAVGLNMGQWTIHHKTTYLVDSVLVDITLTGKIGEEFAVSSHELSFLCRLPA